MTYAGMFELFAVVALVMWVGWALLGPPPPPPRTVVVLLDDLVES